MKANINKFLKGLFFTIISMCALVQLFPLIWLIDFSLCKDTELFSTGILKWPNPPQWQNYVTAWVQGHVGRYLLNSIIVNVTTISIVAILSLTLGYAFTRMEWKFKGFFLTIILLGMMIPVHTTLLPNFLVFKKLGLINTYIGLILPYVAVSLPLGVFLMNGFMKSIPKALEESAVIDGCTTYGIIFKIIFPLVKPAIATVVVMTFLNCWNEFIMAFTYISDNSLRTLPFSVSEFVGRFSASYAVQFAVLTLAALPALIVYIFMNKYITKGVIIGSVKG